MLLQPDETLPRRRHHLQSTFSQRFVIDFWLLYIFITSPCFSGMRDRWKSSGSIINVVPLTLVLYINIHMILEINTLSQCRGGSALFAVLSVTSDHAPCVTLWLRWDLVISWHRMGGASPRACLCLCHKGLLSNYGNILELFIKLRMAIEFTWLDLRYSTSN